MCTSYIFTSDRLGFRNWQTSDIDKLHKINSDKEVMQFFPTTYSKKVTAHFIKKQQTQFITHHFCYFAVEIIETNQFIGFIGLSEQTFIADFNPSIDIGWRLAKTYWHKGYATEGAKACLDYGFYQLELEKIVSTAPKINTPSIAVMKKIGMQKVIEFEHPLLLDYPKLKKCVLFEISKF